MASPRRTRETAETAATDAAAELRTITPAEESAVMADVAEAAKSTRGRKALCKAAMANGQQCELPKGHDGPHNVTTLDEDEIADLDLSDDALAALLGETRTPGIRPTQQLIIDEQVAGNYAEWVAAGENTSKPVWKVKAVDPAKRQATERRLRNAADFHKPAVGMRIKTGPIRDGKAMVIWAAVKRMEVTSDTADTASE